MKGRARVARTPIVRRALQDEVYDAVLGMLLGGEVALGAPLGIDALAARLGVSPTPVREALVRLEATSLVERSAMRGYRVAPPMDADAMAELFEMRLLVEVAAASNAYDRRDVVVPALHRAWCRHAALVEDLTELPEPPSPERASALRRYVDADWSFHRVIARQSRNRYLQAAIERFSTHPLRLHQVISLGAWDSAATLAEHGAIEAAYADGTLADVQDMVRAHIVSVRERSQRSAAPSHS